MFALKTTILHLVLRPVTDFDEGAERNKSDYTVAARGREMESEGMTLNESLEQSWCEFQHL